MGKYITINITFILAAKQPNLSDVCLFQDSCTYSVILKLLFHALPGMHCNYSSSILIFVFQLIVPFLVIYKPVHRCSVTRIVTVILDAVNTVLTVSKVELLIILIQPQGDHFHWNMYTNRFMSNPWLGYEMKAFTILAYRV